MEREAIVATVAMELTPVPCSRCGTALDLQQPDPERPEALLGVCPGFRCALWHLITVLPGLHRAEVLALDAEVHRLVRRGLDRPSVPQRVEEPSD